MFRLNPFCGRKFPEHTHIGGEEFIVLAGTFQDQYGAFPAGTYVRNPIGTKHAPWVDADGCTIFVKLLQMAESDDDTTPLHVSLDQAQREWGKETEYGTVAELYSNRATGEVVEMCWILPNTILPYDSKCAGGEELFILSGSLLLADDTTYNQWGWLRFPPQSDPNALKPRHLTAGPTGAQVYRKTGHLTDHALAMEKIQVNEDDTDGH
jgi:ChrR Cupin-like domain